MHADSAAIKHRAGEASEHSAWVPRHAVQPQVTRTARRLLGQALPLVTR